MSGGREVTLEGLVKVLSAKASESRLMVGIAGPPGAGKSTCADQIKDLLNTSRSCQAAVFQMDGYHYDDGVLISRGLRSRKGAPETFDVSGLRHMLERLRRNEEAEIAVPVFDRVLEISRAGARMIPRTVNVLITEGNYLLLNRSPWSALIQLFDVTVSKVVSEDELRQRLYARWKKQRVSPDEIHAKVEINDLPNGKLVLADSIPADFVLRT